MLANVDYLWTRKQYQYVERARPTEEHVRKISNVHDGPVRVCGFPSLPVAGRSGYNWNSAGTAEGNRKHSKPSLQHYGVPRQTGGTGDGRKSILIVLLGNLHPYNSTCVLCGTPTALQIFRIVAQKFAYRKVAAGVPSYKVGLPDLWCNAVPKSLAMIGSAEAGAAESRKDSRPRHFR